MDFETVTLRIPKAIMRFLREHEAILNEKVEDYLACCVVSSVRADLETNDVFEKGLKVRDVSGEKRHGETWTGGAPKNEVLDAVASPLEVAKKYNLQSIFKVFDIGIFDPDP